MNKYGVKALEYDRWNNELYKQIEERCNSLVGQKFYVEESRYLYNSNRLVRPRVQYSKRH